MKAQYSVLSNQRSVFRSRDQYYPITGQYSDLFAGGGDEEVAEFPQCVADGQEAQGARPLPRT